MINVLKNRGDKVDNFCKNRIVRKQKKYVGLEFSKVSSASYKAYLVMNVFSLTSLLFYFLVVALCLCDSLLSPFW